MRASGQPNRGHVVTETYFKKLWLPNDKVSKSSSNLRFRHFDLEQVEENNQQHFFGLIPGSDLKSNFEGQELESDQIFVVSPISSRLGGLVPPSPLPPLSRVSIWPIKK